MSEIIYVASENTNHQTLGFRNPRNAAEWVEDHVAENDRVEDWELRRYDEGRSKNGWYYLVTEGDMKVAGVIDRVKMRDADD